MFRHGLDIPNGTHVPTNPSPPTTCGLGNRSRRHIRTLNGPAFYLKWSYVYIALQNLSVARMNMLSELGSIVLDTRSLGGFTDAEFYQFCLDNRDLKFERDAQQNIIIMSNTGGQTGNYNAEILADLILWNRKHNLGYCFDSSTAFKLPNGAVRSPDAAWIKAERWEALSVTQKEHFPPLCPDFVLEIKSPSDNLRVQQEKIKEWVANGCRLAWLINPEEAVTYVHSGQSTETIPFDKRLSGEPVVVGFELLLSATLFKK
jgi:Uma2 family endonuclease